MTSDIISPYAGLMAGMALFALIMRMRWFHMLLGTLFLLGGILSAALGYLAGYPILSATAYGLTGWIFTPAAAGFLIWCALWICLFVQHRSSLLQG